MCESSTNYQNNTRNNFMKMSNDYFNYPLKSNIRLEILKNQANTFKPNFSQNRID